MDFMLDTVFDVVCQCSNQTLSDAMLFYFFSDCALAVPL